MYVDNRYLCDDMHVTQETTRHQGLMKKMIIRLNENLNTFRDDGCNGVVIRTSRYIRNKDLFKEVYDNTRRRIVSIF
ncbi:hypothetical protein X777_08796 [Ooceraea biroi]|uniref:Uncharacterized protein n=1 Tax=Ooceraea biroi TaxID=2015173 RepID=A0A026W6L9_OOCBI|nr:hypothetical protein X777_08796 [Ooceraea biroi]